jgi:hypothetical protein
MHHFEHLLVSAKFHRLFDTDKWLLLPEPHIIDKFHEGIDTEMFPKIKVRRLIIFSKQVPKLSSSLSLG